MTDWKAMSGRISLFLRPEGAAPSQSALSLYRSIWNCDPQGFQDAPVPNFPSNAHGRIGSLQATCAKSQSRIDIQFLPAGTSSPSDDGAATIQVISATTELCAELERVIEQVRQGTMGSAFSAFGVFLHFAAPGSGPDARTVKETNAALIAAIPDQYRLSLTDEEDFVLQMNRPQASVCVDRVRTNVITKWSVDRVRVMTFTLSIPSMPGIAMPGTSVGAGTNQPSVFKDFLTPAVTFETNNVPPSPDTNLNAGEIAALLAEGLSNAKQSQQKLGLDVDGFQYAN